MIPALAQQQPGLGAVTADNFNTFVQGGALLADLQNFSGLASMTVYAIGLATAGDGGQGFFYWNTTWTGTPDNTNVIQPYGVTAGAWLRNSSSTADFAAFFRNLPTTLPPLSGIVWNNSGVVSIS